MKNVITFILFTLCLNVQLQAQDQPSKMQLADNLFNRNEYFKCLSIYTDLTTKAHSKVHAFERVADCYRLMNDYENAEIWYEKTVAFANAPLINHYHYAEILLRNKKFKEARNEYQIYYQYENADLLPFKLAVCDSAQKWIQAPVTDYTIKNEPGFNSKYSDWGLNYAGRNTFVFISDRKISNNKKAINNSNGNSYLKLYQKTPDTVSLLDLKIKDNKLFSGDYHIGPMAFSASGDTAFVTITTTAPKSKLSVATKSAGSTQKLYTRRLQLIIATKVNGQWASFKNFKYNNVKAYSVGHAALTKDGNTLYFTSDMPDGQGGTDIWYCTKNMAGNWNAPVNCGKAINTMADECFPTLSTDGKVLYFSSNGLPGMGGLDIFKASGKLADWSKPNNLKYPLNSTSDDFYYVTEADSTGYFSSNREGGKGSDDIYSFNYHGVAPDIIVPSNSGIAPAGNLSNNLPVKINNSPQPVTAIPTLKKGEKIILNNIYYDLNKSNIRPDAAEELDKLVEILEQYPTIRLEISSHTDSRATSGYNLILSRKRAALVVAYLVKKGIAAPRLVAVGYGDTRLLNKCEKGVYCTEEEHQINRRTEVRIIEK